MQYEGLLSLELITRIKEECEAYHINEGINPIGLYCSHTGRLISTISDDEINLIIAANGITEVTPDTLDIFIDRCLLSTRPSPAWIVQDTINMKALLEHDPVGAAVKYLSLAVEHEWRYQKQKSSQTGTGYIKHQFNSLESKKDWMMMVINLFHSLNQITISNLTALTSVLLKADSEIGLQRITPPKTNPMITESGEVVLTLEHWETWIVHYTNVLLEHDSRPIHRQSSGNSRSHARFNHYRKLHTPPSKATIAKKKKDAKDRLVDDVFADLLNLHDGTARVTDTIADRYKPEPVFATPKQTAKSRRGITFTQQGKQNPLKLKLRML